MMSRTHFNPMIVDHGHFARQRRLQRRRTVALPCVNSISPSLLRNFHWRLLGPVPSGELAHRTRVWGGRRSNISTGRAFTHPGGRSALWWADASDNNTIDITGLPPGQHKVQIQLVGADHIVFPGQVVTLPFTVPDYDREEVYGHEH